VMRHTATGQFELALPAGEAIGYFTPEGERDWVPGWDPSYPSGEATESDGTVFVTSHGDTETIWVIDSIDRTAHTSAYSRITIQHHAGTVKVNCTNLGDGRCLVTVNYDMTSLNPQQPDMLDDYKESSFKAMINEWATGIAATLDPDPRP
jgi:hypothetical protein